MTADEYYQLEDCNTSTDDRIDVDPVIEVYKRDIDRSLLRENLKLTVEQRVRKLQELQRFAAELRSAGRQATHD